MANHKSSKKRVLVTAKKNAAVKTENKKAIQAIAAGDKAAAISAVRSAESKMMKAAGKTMPKKRASRKVSRLTRAAAKLA